jgi:hypothetical protein
MNNSHPKKDGHAVALASLMAYFKVDPDEEFLWSRKLSALVLPLLHMAIDRAIDQFPPGRLSFCEFLGVVRECRKALVAVHPHTPCTACERSPGWVEARDAKGVPRMSRCPCWLRWKDGLEALIGFLPAETTRASGGGGMSVAALAADLGSAQNASELNRSSGASRGGSDGRGRALPGVAAAVCATGRHRPAPTIFP